MTTIYYHFLRFLANQQAASQIRALVRAGSSKYIKFRYSEGTLSTKVTWADLSATGFRMIEEEAEKLSVQIQRVLAERQSTFDRLDRERYGSEDAL